MKKPMQQNFDGPRTNRRIRASEVRVIHEGKNLGVMKFNDALEKAQSLELDLVEVSPNAKPPVCNIIDIGKYMYEKSKREKNSKSTQVKEKDIIFRYVIDEHDLETKANQAKQFLEKGYRVRLVVKFKAREKAHKDQGFSAIKSMMKMLTDIADVDKEPSLEGSTITARLRYKKPSKNEHGSSSVQTTDVATNTAVATKDN